MRIRRPALTLRLRVAIASGVVVALIASSVAFFSEQSLRHRVEHALRIPEIKRTAALALQSDPNILAQREMRKHGRDLERALDRDGVAVVLHQHGGAGGAEVGHAGEVEAHAARPFAGHAASLAQNQLIDLPIGALFEIAGLGDGQVFVSSLVPGSP